MISVRHIVAVAALASVASVAGCNGILGIDPGHLDTQTTADGGTITDSSTGGDVVIPADGSGGPCKFDDPNSQFDKGCTFGP